VRPVAVGTDFIAEFRNTSRRMWMASDEFERGLEAILVSIGLSPTELARSIDVDVYDILVGELA
jgi:hypothetical protein